MVLEGETKIYESNGRYSIYIPAGLIKDSAFPFKTLDRLKIRVESGKLIISKPDTNWHSGALRM
jgi:hypothetical protein